MVSSPPIQVPCGRQTAKGCTSVPYTPICAPTIPAGAQTVPKPQQRLLHPARYVVDAKQTGTNRRNRISSLDSPPSPTARLASMTSLASLQSGETGDITKMIAGAYNAKNEELQEEVYLLQ